MFESRNECNWYAVVVVNRILAELRLLSKGISPELILSFKTIGLIHFRGFITPQKFFGSKKISGCST